MAEIVVTAAVTVLIEKLLSADLMKLARSKGIDSQLKKLKKKLDLIKTVLADAEQKHITQSAVRLWLQELQDLAYDIDDVLDDMATEIMARKLNEKPRGSTSTSEVLKKIIPTCCTNFTPHNMIYRHKMSSKLDEITVNLNDLVEQKNSLGLDVNEDPTKLRSSRNNERLEQTSQVDVSQVLGREGDKAALLEKLLGDEACNQYVSIVSIVGLGGIGKTTLAKVLYNDDKVKDHFELRAWVCVSDEFDVFSISKVIYQAVTGEEKAFASLDLLHVALKEKLSKKRFLIVLDDVWNEDHKVWEILERPLVGVPGSKIIVTTRKTKVASVMNSVQPHILKVLSDKHALSLFAKYALDEHNFDKHLSLLPIAQGIVEKCDGLPLALIALGRVLKTKGSDEDEWEQLLKSEIWSSDDGRDILPALKLSYYDLPSQLKQLFAYCCLFPKDYLFNKNELVLLWVAEGFLNQPKGNMSMERLGCQCFEELQSRSFFQRSMDDESGYTMHDLMNDLAIHVAGEFFFMLDDKMDLNGRNEAFEKFRHFSLTGQRGAEFVNLKELHRSRRLRTFLPVSVGQTYRWTSFDRLDHVLVELLPRLQFLRVLSLTNKSISKVPQSVGGLKHLRYLNFSYTIIEEVPKQVSELYNLQSLLVRGCDKLSRLPVSFAKLINLRHLDMSDTPLLNKTPLGIGGLTSLQTLSKVFIERGTGFKISDLKGLWNLQGQLSIKGLEKVTDLKQAKDANLENKGLVCLDMEWSDVFDDSRNSMIEYEVIQRLRPHTKLNKLKIWGYGGIKFPTWFVDRSFPHLREIHIKNCPKLVKVSLGLIPSLEVLVIKRCSEAVFRAMVDVSSAIRELTIWSIKDLTKLDGEVLKHLQAVEDIRIEECDELRYLWDSESEACRFLVKLQKLGVRRCKKLVSMEEKEVNVGSSNMKSVIRKVTVENCDSLESYNCPNSVRELEIIGCSSLTSLTLSTTLQELPSSLEFLDIKDCSNLNSFPHELPSSLNYLRIDNCSNLNSFPHELPSSLKYLQISDCSNLNSFPHELPSFLVYLRIDNCSSLNSFPHELSFSLEYLIIDIYSNLNSFPHELPSSLETLHISNSNLNSFPHELPSSLNYLRIDNCSSLNSFPHELPSSLEYLIIDICSNLNSFPHELPSSLNYLRIDNCSNLNSFPHELPSSLKYLQIIDCGNLNSFPHELPSSLKYLRISNCNNLNSFPHQRLQSLTSLEEMRIDNCESMDESFPCGLWPPNLKILRIGMLKKPMSEWMLQNYPPSLVELRLYGSNSGVVSFAMEEDASNTDSASFLLPPSLTELWIKDFKDVESISEVVLQHLTHLQSLVIKRCPNIRHVPQSTSSLEVDVYKEQKRNGRCIIGT